MDHHPTLSLVVIFIFETGIHRVLPLSWGEPLCASVSQFLLQKNHILRVALIDCVRNVTQKWNQSDSEIDGHVQLHPANDRAWEGRLDRAACSKDHQCEQKVNNIANTGSMLARVLCEAVKMTYPGISPTSAPRPNLKPQELNIRSILYARRFALVRTRSSSGESPGGSAFVFFFLNPRRLAGTCSK